MQNLEIVKVDAERNPLMIKGAIPARTVAFGRSATL